MSMKSKQRIFWIFWIFFWLVAGLIVTSWGVGIWASLEVIKIIQVDGLKSLVDTIWLGTK